MVALPSQKYFFKRLAMSKTRDALKLTLATHSQYENCLINFKSNKTDK